MHILAREKKNPFKADWGRKKRVSRMAVMGVGRRDFHFGLGLRKGIVLICSQSSLDEGRELSRPIEFGISDLLLNFIPELQRVSTVYLGAFFFAYITHILSVVSYFLSFSLVTTKFAYITLAQHLENSW